MKQIIRSIATALAVALASLPLASVAKGAQGQEMPAECRRDLNPVELYKNPQFLETILRCLNQTNQQPGRGGPLPQESTANEGGDCLVPVDPQMLERLRGERNVLLREMAGGGYMVDLTLTAMGKLIAARLQHLADRNPDNYPLEGIVTRTQGAVQNAPAAVVDAGKAVATYLTNSNEANHRYLYSQVQVGIDNADQALQQMLRNPHVTIATVADGLLVGRATGATGTVCRQLTARQIAQVKNKIDEAREGAKRLKRLQEMNPPTAVCGLRREDCFWQTLANATGDRSYLLRQQGVASWDEVFDTLKRHFGGAKAKDPLTRRAGDLQMIAEGKPVFVNRGEFSNVLRDLPDNSEGMLFILRTDGSSHVFNLAKFAGRSLYWDNQAQSSDIAKLFAGVQNVKWYRYK